MGPSTYLPAEPATPAVEVSHAPGMGAAAAAAGSGVAASTAATWTAAAAGFADADVAYCSTRLHGLEVCMIFKT